MYLVLVVLSADLAHIQAGAAHSYALKLPIEIKECSRAVVKLRWLMDEFTSDWVFLMNERGIWRLNGRVKEYVMGK